jgi:hypothetical protein
MKIKKTKLVKVEEEVSIPEILEMLFEYDWWPDDWEGTRDSFITALEYDNPDITKEEIKTILPEAKKEFDRRVKDLMEEEAEQLKDRRSIINWLHDIDKGNVGYYLTLDQIVDLIIQNGNKI